MKKHVGLIALAMLMFVVLIWVCYPKTNTQQSPKSASIAEVKRPAAPTNLRISDAKVKSEDRLTASAFRIDSLFEMPWVTSMTGLVGAVSCATCHAGKQAYCVKKGDTLSGIAHRYGQKNRELHEDNRGVVGDNPDEIYPGQILLVTVQSVSIPSRASEIRQEQQAKRLALAGCALSHPIPSEIMARVNCTPCHKGDTVAAGQAKRLVVTRRAARSSSPSDHFDWVNPAGNSFGLKRDNERAINSFNLPTEVKAAFIGLLDNTVPAFAVIEVGDRFSQMIFGKYRVVDNVVAAWKPKSRALAAQHWSYDYQGRRYELWRPLICNNWAWRSSPLPSPPTKITIKEPPPPVTEAPPTPEPPPPVTEAPPTPEPPPAVEIPQSPCIRLAWEGNTFGGSRWSVSGNARHDFMGLNAAAFPEDCQHGMPYYRVGPSAEVVWFSGHIADGDYLKYKGDRLVIGGAAQYLTPTTKTEGFVRPGRKQFEVNTAGGYGSDEWISILNTDVIHSDWDTGIDKVKMLQYAVHADWDLGGHKNSQINNAHLSASRDPRIDGSEFSGRIRAVGYEMGKTGLFPAVQLEAGYLPGPRIFAVEPRVGVELDDEGSTELAAAYRFQFQKDKTDDDTFGASYNFSLNKGVPKVWRWFKSWFGNQKNGS